MKIEDIARNKWIPRFLMFGMIVGFIFLAINSTISIGLTILVVDLILLLSFQKLEKKVKEKNQIIIRPSSVVTYGEINESGSAKVYVDGKNTGADLYVVPTGRVEEIYIISKKIIEGYKK